MSYDRLLGIQAPVMKYRFIREFDSEYCDNNGIYWLRVGSEKRRARPEDIKRLVVENGHLSVEEKVLSHSIIENFDISVCRAYHEKKYEEALSTDQKIVNKILANKQLLKGDNLTLAGALLFSKEKQFLHPNFCIKAVSFFGNDKKTTQYRDSEDFHGSITYLYRSGIAFINRKMPKIQKSKSFNNIGELEIPTLVFEELLANALVHRDYYYAEPIELLIFDDRIEINNPGAIPPPLSVEDIKHGNAKPRNSIIVAFVTDLIPYRGLGTGIQRAYEVYSDIEIEEDRRLNRISCIINRPRATNISQITVEKTVEKILNLLKDNPKISTAALANETGLSRRGIEWNIQQLKAKGLISRIGPDKGGYWEIMGH